ncbi:MAG: carboxymuconolactone decarboxylase family protein [Pseudomonadota bacterium]|nr:carboxymuconolactone decarboxylase family protein [Pseudomonadota bacterium]
MRLNYLKGDGWRAVRGLAEFTANCSLDQVLLELVKLRASQVNGCANCVNLHANRLREAGQSEERIQNVVVWWEAKCFNEREKAAFAWTESITLVAETHVPDDIYERACRHFSEQEVIDLTYAICAINVHNRLAVAFRRIPGQ